MRYTTLIDTIHAGRDLGRSVARDRGLPLRSRPTRAGRAGVRDGAHSRARSTRTSTATCRRRRPDATAAIRCPTSTRSRATLGRLRHRRRRRRSSSTTRTTACSRAGCGGCCAGSAMTRSAVLDGGFAKWMAERRPTEPARKRGAAPRSSPHPRASMVADGRAEMSQRARRQRLASARRARARALSRRGRADRQGRRATSPARSTVPFTENLDARRHVQARRDDCAANSQPSLGDTPPDHVVVLLRIGRDRVPQPARDGARRPARREVVCGIVERMVVGSVAAGRTTE